MANPSKALFVAVSLASLLLASMLPSTPAAAGNVSFNLFGSRPSGWGSTNTSLSTPGPGLTVNQGDNVTLVLTSVDGRRHNWFIDYDNDAADDPNEPKSPDFRTSVVTWNFTANRNGTFVYRSLYDLATMWGLITIRPAGSPPSDGAPGISTLLLGAGLGAILVAVFAVVAILGRRGRMPKEPPPPRER